jgi:hypothetical protein
MSQPAADARPAIELVSATKRYGAAVALDGRIANVAFMGNHTRITVDTPAGAVVVMRAHGMGARAADVVGEIGQEACVWWSAGDAAFVGNGQTTRGGGTDGSA